MLLHQLVETAETVRATRSRKAKTAALAACLQAAEAEELPVVAAYLAGTLTQRRTGLGWRSLTALPPPAGTPTLTVLEVDRAFGEVATLAGPGSQQRRADAVDVLFGAATAAEQRHLRGLVTGELRQGALEGQLVDAIAAAFDVPVDAVRRAVMLSGSTPAAATAAAQGLAALQDISLVVGRGVKPMLASSAPDVGAALAKAGGEVAVDAKLDGIRVQVHRRGDEVRVFSRSLDDLTARLPEVVAVARALPVDQVVLDGEALLMGTDGRPMPFQDTASTSMTHGRSSTTMAPYFFDVLHLDGADLLDLPLRDRLPRLDALVPEEYVVPRLLTTDAAEAADFVRETLARGHEGVVVKDLASSWEAGRRGSAWVKVKPVLTLDLVVLAVEWGSGRRRGWLSNIHLGARNPDGSFTMLGKTFKGMTDEMLAWQTERFLELETGRDGHVVRVRPEQVVEIAFDGLQRSTRYPGGVALRFARVVRYRDDKTADEADTLDTVRGLVD
jgi:DNA ligase-1